MFFQKYLVSSIAVLCLASFVACGGGSSSQTNTTPGNAQGVYAGTSTTGSNSGQFVALVTPNDVVYAVYASSTGTNTVFDGLLIGNGSENKTTFTANVSDFLAAGTVANGTLSGTFAAGASFNGTLTEGGSTVALSGQVPPTTLFNYSNAAQLATATGNWSGTLLDGETATFSVDSTGAVTGSTSLNCSFTGKVAPNASGKNFYDVTITFGASNCLAPGASASGAAIIAGSGGSYQMIAAVHSADNSVGTALMASNTAALTKTHRLF